MVHIQNPMQNAGEATGDRRATADGEVDFWREEHWRPQNSGKLMWRGQAAKRMAGCRRHRSPTIYYGLLVLVPHVHRHHRHEPTNLLLSSTKP